MVFRGPADAIKNGLVYLPEERKKEGIFPLLSVRENLCVAAFEQFKRFLGLDRRRMVDRTRENISRIGIKTPGSEAPIKNLSGGNQQKVIIARWTALLANGLSLMNVSAYWARVVVGGIVLIAILGDLLRRRGRT